MIQEEQDNAKKLLKSTISKLTENLQSEKNRVKELEARLKEAEESIATFKKSGGTSPIRASDKEKKIVELYAQGIPAGFIYKIFIEQLYIDIGLQDIEKLIMYVDSNSPKLPLELMEHYILSKKTFTEKSTLEKGFFASSLYNKFKLLEGEYSISLMKAKDSDDEEAKRKILDQMAKLLQIQASVFSKNTLSIFGNKNAENITADYDKEVSSLFDSEDSNVIRFKKKA